MLKTILKEIFDLHQVKSATEKADILRNNFIPEIKQKIWEPLSCFDEGKS